MEKYLVIVPSKFSICYNKEMLEETGLKVIVPSKFSICYNELEFDLLDADVIVPSKFSICYNTVVSTSYFNNGYSS